MLLKIYYLYFIFILCTCYLHFKYMVDLLCEEGLRLFNIMRFVYSGQILQVSDPQLFPFKQRKHVCDNGNSSKYKKNMLNILEIFGYCKLTLYGSYCQQYVAASNQRTK